MKKAAAHLLAARCVEEKGDQGGRARRQAVVSQQSVLNKDKHNEHSSQLVHVYVQYTQQYHYLELILANDVLCKFDVQLVFRPENLDVLRHFRSEIFDGPRAQYRVFVLCRCHIVESAINGDK